MLTTREAAERLGVTDRRIRAMIADGVLRAKRVGRDHLISERDLAALIEDRRQRGIS